MWPLLSDHDLVEAYLCALRLRLDKEFIQLLRYEIGRRKLNVPDEQAV